MNEMMLVAIGGFFGAIVRFAVSKHMQGRNKLGIPTGTLIVNLSGAFLLGLLISLGAKGYLYALIGTGFMGAFTTFSTLSLEAVQMKMAQKDKLFIQYLVNSYVFGLLLAFCGLIIGKII